MTEPGDIVAAYLAIALGDGARGDDPRLFALFERMTSEEVQRVKEGLIAECVKELPSGPTGAPVADCADLYLEIVRRGAKPDDPRLHMLMSAMSDDECERAKAAIAELWLAAQPIPARPNLSPRLHWEWQEIATDWLEKAGAAHWSGRMSFGASLRNAAREGSAVRAARRARG